LGFASVKDSNTTSGDLEVKVILSQICSSIDDLNNHFLSIDGARSEGQFVASTARLILALSSDDGSSKSVSDIVDDERLIIVTNEGRSTVASALGVLVTKNGHTILGTSVDWLGHWSFAWP
jgi:hypothetical protein